MRGRGRNIKRLNGTERKGSTPTMSTPKDVEPTNVSHPSIPGVNTTEKPDTNKVKGTFRQ